MNSLHAVIKILPISRANGVKGREFLCDYFNFRPLNSKEIMYGYFECGILDNPPISITQ
jgi:hypothetical protein